MYGSKLKHDVIERALWTGAEGALGVLATEIADVTLWWAVPVAALIASAKGWIAGRLGARGTASTLPASKDPATPPRTVGLGPRAGGTLG
ncbi:hypothetical protein ACIQPP_05665 [Streptomyces violaceusniger]|uniref:hypothetical protein n=1 Tax=Streptomyces violaceusniger TaxID=68280 RepID=UPI0009980479|nr:hypothetical protein [Streptomyces hygroscopicus]AQW55308.1 hypothetical protein SHXM_08771 [Streptomyces hygroscopicus]